jgi:tetratricopeptide (TPR) repeat protein
VLTLDTTRYDALSYLGGPAGASPRLDALARESLAYTQARTTVPLTLPAHASLFTGLVPPRHGVRINGNETLPESALTLAERARERGYQTAAFIGAVVIADVSGMAQGFEVFDQPTPPLVLSKLQYERRPASEVAQAALAWIATLDPARPFLGWAHFYDPHLPHAPAPDLAARFGGDSYHAAVATMDREIGRILDALAAAGRLEDTFIVVVADHGEGRGEHREDTHGTQIYDSTMRIPFFLRYPDGYRAGERSAEPVSIVDVYPTLVEGLALGPLNDVDGLSLYRRAVPEGRGVFFESLYAYNSFGWSPLVGWACASGKYVHSSRPEFYRPLDDPGERKDLIASLAAEELEPLRRGIQELGTRAALSRAERTQADPELARALAALGYASGAATRLPPTLLSDVEAASPHDMQDVHALFLHAQSQNNAEQASEAVALLRRIVERDPNNTLAWFQLGGALIHTGAYAESLEASNRALALGPVAYGPLLNVALAEEHMGRPEEALAAYGGALALEPNLIQALERCVEIAAALGRPGEADAFRVRLIEAQERAAGG